MASKNCINQIFFEKFTPAPQSLPTLRIQKNKIPSQEASDSRLPPSTNLSSHYYNHLPPLNQGVTTTSEAPPTTS